MYGLYVCREGERILFYHFFSVSGWECLSLDVVSLSVERCCLLLVVDCMYINTFQNCVSLLLYRLFLFTFVQIVPLYFCTVRSSIVLIL